MTTETLKAPEDSRVRGRLLSNPLPHDDAAAAQEIKRRTAAIEPLLREAGTEIESIGKLPPHVVEAMYEAGLYTLGVPKRFGGYPQMSDRDSSEILLAVGRGSGAAAWSVAISNGGGHFIMGFSDRVIEEVFTSHHIGPLTSGSLINQSLSEGVGRRVDGGFMVRGTWSFSSNVRLSKWQMGGFDWDDNGTLRRNFMVIPREDLKVGDDWHTWGLQGTGSNSAYAPEEVFVPDYRTVPHEEYGKQAMRHGPVHLPDPAIDGCLSIGMAYAALEAFIEKAKKRAPVAQSYKTIADIPATQMIVANAMTTIKSCEATMMYWADRADSRRAAAKSSNAPPTGPFGFNVEEKLGTSHACVDVLKRLRGVVEELAIAMGSSTLLISDPIGRNFRDITAISMHIWHRPHLQAENFGKYLFGIENPLMFGGGNVASEPRRAEPRKMPILE